MIFASDLDRTLIYSNNFLKPGMLNITIVERKDGQALSHMTNKTMDLLTKINEKLLFIPTTTRSLEQYKRIHIFQNVIHTKYAIIANGGIILKNNVIDSNWEEIIKIKMDTIISPIELIRNCQFFLKQEEVNSFRCCDNLFIYAVLKTNIINIEAYNKLEFLCNKFNYNVTINGRKIYIIPAFLNKWEPIKYIMSLEGPQTLITAGDSILDLPMLKNSDFGIIPLHGELFKLYKTTIDNLQNAHFTNTHGIQASDELLETIMGQLLTKTS